MANPEIHVDETYSIVCPGEKVRLVHTLNNGNTALSSEKNDSDTMMLETQFRTNPVPIIQFRCHDCPLPDLKGCVTNIKDKPEHVINTTIASKLSKQTISNLYAVAIKNDPQPDNVLPINKPTQLTTPTILKEIETIIPDDRPPSVSLAQMKQEIAAYDKDHPEEINDSPANPFKFISIYLSLTPNPLNS